MTYPMVGRKKRGKMTVTALSGGLNFRDLPTEVGDDQLTECENFWFKDGVLKSRPALQVVDTTQKGGYGTYLAGSDARYAMRQDGAEVTTGEYAADGTARWNTESLFVAAATVLRVKYDAARLSGWSDGESDGTLLFLSNGQIYAPLADGGYRSLSDFVYVPQLLVGGVGAEDHLADRPHTVLHEQRNLLTPAFRAAYTTDGTGKVFYLPVEKLDTIRPVTATYLDRDGNTVIHTIAAGETVEQGEQSDGLCMHYSAFRRCVYFVNAAEELTAPAAAGVSDNLVITAYTPNDTEGFIGRMTLSCWYGGRSSGLTGGTRLFASGHPDHPNRVYWSDPENPLYFPAGNYVGVGELGQAVTAFGKQGELLVIFKERELYAASYMTRSSADLADACFTLFPLHGEVGCDCPNTVQLCNNRLVWACSDGKVYSLTGNNPYNGCNVRPISAMVESRIREHTTSLKSASAVCYDGWYLLATDSTVWAFCYADTAFDRLASYATGDEMAARGMVWYRWQFSVNVHPERVLSVDGSFLLVDRTGRTYLLGGTVDTVMLGDTVWEKAIEGTFCTKLYDFGHPDTRKTVREAAMIVGAEEDCEMTVTYITDTGIQVDSRQYATRGRDAAFADFFRLCRMTPHATRVRHFGLSVKTVGAVSVQTLIVRYDIDNLAQKGDTLYGHYL